MGFPKKSEILEALKRLEKKEGSLALRSDASPHEKFRFELCQIFVRYKREHHLKPNELAHILEIDETKVSNILRNRIKEFSTDSLIDLYSRLDPGAIKSGVSIEKIANEKSEKLKNQADERRWVEAGAFFESDESHSVLENSISNSFFHNDFSFDEEMIEDQAVGVLGPNASYEQKFKYSLCEVIRSKVLEKESIDLKEEIITEIVSEEIELLKNLRIDHFSIARLLKITESLVKQDKLQQGLKAFIEAIS